MMVHFCLASYSWHIWTLEVSIFAYYIPCSLLCVLLFLPCIGCDALKVNSAVGDSVNFQPQCNMQCLNFQPYMIGCYTDRVLKRWQVISTSQVSIASCRICCQVLDMFWLSRATFKSTASRPVSFMAQTICVVFLTFQHIALHRTVTPHA